jgi:putative ABC transport system ATP-binding protein
MDRADLRTTQAAEERGSNVSIDIERTSDVEGVAVTDPIASTGLVKTYHQGDEVIHALRGVDLTVVRGEFVAITGASGSGKSTLLHIIGGLDRPDEGEVMLEGKRISEMSDEDLSLVRRRRLGFVLQFFNLLPTLSALENAAFPLLLDGRADALDRARSSLESVGLTGRVDHRPAHLSGGEQQRVALARALVTQPAVVLADEPTGNLDSLTGEDILKLLRATADAGQTIVMVTHDARSASYADRVLRIVDGRLAEVGDAS